MIYLTRDDILYANSHVITNVSFIESRLPEANINYLEDEIDYIVNAAVRQQYELNDMTASLASFYLLKIVASETFRCGKGRIAILVIIIFLRNNGFKFKQDVEEEDLFVLAFEVIEKRFDLGQISKWITERIIPDWYDPIVETFPFKPSLN